MNKHFEITGQSNNGLIVVIVESYDILGAVNAASAHGLYSYGIVSVRLVAAPVTVRPA